VKTARVLVVDDEPVVLDVVSRYLIREGFSVSTATDGESALTAFQREQPHLVVLDLMLPKVSGMEVCRAIRQGGDVPIIMLTARGDEMDRIAGFEVGADDYLAKPFSPRELVARIRAVLKRSFDQGEFVSGSRKAGAIVINGDTREVTTHGTAVKLTAREFDLLWFLVNHPGKVFNRFQLLEQVWRFEWPGDASTVTVHMRRLRTKIEDRPEAPRHLKTVWGVGYRWDS
jgi:two-component system, OmpR family, response regulator ResD